ncbi:MAG: hypothetical protein M3N33_00835 [Actinomycetota bacterium]|nr:hypothetical protein [Actinomycetota bacterium]
MIDFFKSISPFAAFVGTLFGAGSLAVAIFRWPRKKLWWEIVHSLPVVEAFSDPSATIDFGGCKFDARHVHNIVIEVLNSGNTDIEVDQYERPLTFKFGDKAQILSAEVLYEEPDAIHASLTHTPTAVTLKPVLLNAGDVVGIRMLVANPTGIRSDGRVVGVTKIKMGSAELRSATQGLLGSIIALMFIPAVFFPDLLPPALRGVATALLVVGMIMATVGLVMAGRDLRWERRRVVHTDHLVPPNLFDREHAPWGLRLFWRLFGRLFGR